MYNENYIKELYEYIKNYRELPTDVQIDEFNKIALDIYNKRNMIDSSLLESIEYIIKTCNIIYENTSYTLLDDDFYDAFVELYKSYNSNFPIGAENIEIKPKRKMIKYIKDIDRPKEMLKRIDTLDRDNMLFYNDLFVNVPSLDRLDCMRQSYDNNQNISKRKVISEQSYPELVGTLDKCKFVLNTQAQEKGAFNEDNVKIFERDFIQKHIMGGLYGTNDIIDMTCELKYDGVSIAAELIGDTIISAQTRGDVKEGLSADLTPIFGGYKFYHASMLPDELKTMTYGVKFEAIMNKYNLMKYNQIKNKNYANCRTAIIGLLGSSDAHLYRDLITLIPLEISFLANEPRNIQIEFLNRFYRNPEINRYSIISGNYMSILYQVKKFVEDSELLRDFIPYMYDGVVISYNDPQIRSILGRDNNVNKYSMAIKFSPLKKLTTFLGYTFTVGQDGTITPMIHFNPIMFFGTVHNKASGHSYARFMELGLRTGDIIEVEYTNDVMAYVTKPNNDFNINNMNVNVLCSFPEYCPSCGSKLELSESKKNIKCTNINCDARNLARVDNMFKKLNLKDFSESFIKKIGKYHMYELFELGFEDLEFLGEVNSFKFIKSLYDLKTNSIYDYKIIGSLGFTNVATEKWKTILKVYDIYEILQLLFRGEDILKDKIINIKGIGPETANTIVRELPFFIDDIAYISVMDNVKSIKKEIESLNIKKIRFTGCRDMQLIKHLSDLGHDITGGSLTKDTDILLIPYAGFESSKTKKAISNNSGTIIVPIGEFENNMDYYLL